MKRILLVLTVALMMAVMLTAMAMPALARAPQGDAGQAAGQQTAATNFGASGASTASNGKAQPPGIVPLGCLVLC
jgi:hypothetical protein